MDSPKWKLKPTKQFDKSFGKLDKKTRQQVQKYVTDLVVLEDPKVRGKELKANKTGIWAYRIGNYRLLVEILEDVFVILALDVDHRSKIYENKR